MSFRTWLSHALIRLGNAFRRAAAFLQSLPVVIMKPDELVAFGLESYSTTKMFDYFTRDKLVDKGLTKEEKELLAEVPEKTGDLLLLGVGGGREAIPLAQMGFRVTGVDFVEGMVSRAQENAKARGVEIVGLVQDISRLDVPDTSFDIVWLSCSMYSCIPSRARRVEMVRRIARSLRPGGFFICQYSVKSGTQFSRRGKNVRKFIRWLTQGNQEFEQGDSLWQNAEFLHLFGSVDEVTLELEEAGLVVIRTGVSSNGFDYGAVSQKK